MPKYKVKRGYAFIDPKNKQSILAGNIIELPEAQVQDQLWKLDPLPAGEEKEEAVATSEGTQDGDGTASEQKHERGKPLYQRKPPLEPEAANAVEA